MNTALVSREEKRNSINFGGCHNGTMWDIKTDKKIAILRKRFPEKAYVKN